MSKLKAFLKRKDIVFSPKRYGIDALGAMAQGLFCSLLVGTIVKTLGQQLALDFLVRRFSLPPGTFDSFGADRSFQPLKGAIFVCCAHYTPAKIPCQPTNLLRKAAHGGMMCLR